MADMEQAREQEQPDARRRHVVASFAGAYAAELERVARYIPPLPDCGGSVRRSIIEDEWSVVNAVLRPFHHTNFRLEIPRNGNSGDSVPTGGTITTLYMMMAPFLEDTQNLIEAHLEFLYRHVCKDVVDRIHDLDIVGNMWPMRQRRTNAWRTIIAALLVLLLAIVSYFWVLDDCEPKDTIALIASGGASLVFICFNAYNLREMHAEATSKRQAIVRAFKDTFKPDSDNPAPPSEEGVRNFCVEFNRILGIPA